MKHAGRGIRASSPRAIGRLACGSQGARRKGNPNVKPPRDESARLWLSWSTPEGNPNVEPPNDRSACLEYTVVWEIFIRSSNMSTVGWLPAKRDNTMPGGGWPNDTSV